METIYRHHPRFRDAAMPVWFGAGEGDTYPASIEGGDVLVLDEHVVVVGIGERTSPSAVEILARRLFAADAVEQVIVVHLRKARSQMHLDTVFTMVDRHCFNVFPGLLDTVDVHVMTPADGGRIKVRPAAGLEPALGEALGLDRVTWVQTGGDAIGRLREQWDDGNNTLALEPGVVVAYKRNQETNRRLREAGIEVLELDASELCRGRGGSRCMTQPLARAVSLRKIAVLQADRHPVECGRGQWETILRRCDDIVHVGVGVIRVVAGEHELAHLGGDCCVDRSVRGAVPPSGSDGVLPLVVIGRRGSASRHQRRTRRGQRRHSPCRPRGRWRSRSTARGRRVCIR